MDGSNGIYRLIIAGGRDFDNYSLLEKEADKFLEQYQSEKIIIVSGRAKGADTLGERYANKRGYEIEKYPADWDKYGKKAGILRNVEMSKVGDGLLAFWDEQSTGTKNMIENATKRKLEVKVVIYGSDSEDKVVVFTDGGGGTKHQNFVGGIGVVLKYKEHTKTISEGYENATNNKMELTACIRALESINKKNIPIEVYCDSAYVVNCFNEKWYETWRNNGWKNSKKKEVENRDLWERLLELYESFKNVKWCKVKGHVGVELNELADQLATEGYINKIKELEGENES